MEVYRLDHAHEHRRLNGLLNANSPGGLRLPGCARCLELPRTSGNPFVALP